MKYKVGQKFYKEENNRLSEVEVESICYVLKNGTIKKKKYISEEGLEEAIVEKTVYLDKDFYTKKKLNEKIEQMKKLQEEIEYLQSKNK